MIARLDGIVLEKSPSHVVVECNGIGFRISIPVSTSEVLPAIGQRTALHTHLLVREDAFELVGFATVGERDAFQLLITIPGVGVRTALGILSAMSVGQLQQAVLSNNIAQLQRIPGVGRKTAERLVLELRERIGAVEVKHSAVEEASLLLTEALSAMIVLGYNRQQAEKAIRVAFDDCRRDGIEPSLEVLVKRALRIIAG
ncbi:MAG: Holliday junction branch migration protein RuvA [Chlorobi bacterium]|nr:Holliday junction branch migration protein RuvA [Chlorobiota bacterium]